MIPNIPTKNQLFMTSIAHSIPYLDNSVPKRARASIGLRLEPTKGREECKRDPLKSPVLGFNNTGAGWGRARLAWASCCWWGWWWGLRTRSRKTLIGHKLGVLGRREEVGRRRCKKCFCRTLTTNYTQENHQNSHFWDSRGSAGAGGKEDWGYLSGTKGSADLSHFYDVTRDRVSQVWVLLVHIRLILVVSLFPKPKGQMDI
jgi:hypothetical protein